MRSPNNHASLSFGLTWLSSPVPLFDRDQAVERHDRFIEDNNDWAYFHIAQIYARAGDPDAAFEWLGRAYEARDVQMADLITEVLFKDLHDDPRWTTLLARMGLSEEQ